MISTVSILIPPIAFLIVFAAVIAFALLLARFAFKTKSAAGTMKAYACGEEPSNTMVKPDYGQFFPFAFFFTILHVAALMITTVPVETAAVAAIAMIYVAGAIVGLFVLYRR